MLVVNCPAGHGPHARSLVEVGCAVTSVPAPQLLAGVQVVALAAVLYELAGHAMHTRSVAAVGSALTR